MGTLDLTAFFGTWEENKRAFSRWNRLLSCSERLSNIQRLFLESWGLTVPLFVSYCLESKPAEWWKASWGVEGLTEGSASTDSTDMHLHLIVFCKILGFNFSCGADQVPPCDPFSVKNNMEKQGGGGGGVDKCQGCSGDQIHLQSVYPTSNLSTFLGWHKPLWHLFYLSCTL